MTRVVRLNVTLLSLGLGLLQLTWVFSTGPFVAPDEPAHYLHALGIANGSFLGPKVPAHGLNAAQTAFVTQDSRGVLVDARTAPPGVACVTGTSVPVGRKCLAAGWEGNFEPLPYLLPAAAIKVAGSSNRGLWLGRLASALVCFAFIALAVALLCDESHWRTVGLLAAVTPSALFVGSVINPNGLEIAANLAFVASLLRISDGVPAGPFVWVVAAVSGATVLLAWQLGWVFAAADVLAVAAISGRARVAEAFRQYRSQIRSTGLILLAAFLIYLVWGLEAQLLHGTFGISPLGAGLSGGATQLRNSLYGSVAVFGLLDVGLPAVGYYWIWWSLVVLIVVGALATASRQERLALTVIVLLSIAFPILFYAWVQRHSGFGLQARHVMPELALIPLVAGALLARHRDRLPRGLIAFTPAAITALVALYQLFAWWVNSRTSAGKPTSFWFLTNPHWSPPGGWTPWVVTAALGTTLLLSAAALALRDGYVRVWHAGSRA